MKLVEVIPFAIATTGILLDALTTVIGLSKGFHETHPSYSPLWAFLIFWSLIAMTRLLPRTRLVHIFTLILSAAPFLGAVNNSLIITGVL